MSYIQLLLVCHGYQHHLQILPSAEAGRRADKRMCRLAEAVPFSRSFLLLLQNMSALTQTSSTREYPHGLGKAAGGHFDAIKSIETFRVRPRWLFVKVETESGIVGWGGEPFVLNSH